MDMCKSFRVVAAVFGLAAVASGFAAEEAVRPDGSIGFTLATTLVAATDKFTDSNKLGRGGYGPVYKVIGSVHLIFITNLAIALSPCKISS